MGFYISPTQALAIALATRELSIAFGQGNLAFPIGWIRTVGDPRATQIGEIVEIVFNLGKGDKPKLVQIFILFRSGGATAEVTSFVLAPPWRLVTEWNLVGGGRSVTLPSSEKFPYSDVSFFV